MKILPLILLFFGSALYSVSYAQYYEEPDTIVIEKKNTLGLYINPAASFMMNSVVHNPRWGIQYRHILTHYKRLRLSLLTDFINYSRPDDGFNTDSFVSAADSSFTLASETRRQRKTNLRVGMEWSSYHQKSDALFGLDILAGYKTDEYDLRHLTYSYYKNSASGDSVYTINPHPIRNEKPYAYLYKFVELGISPVVGWRFDIKNHWELVATISPEVSVAIPVQSEWRGEHPMPVGSQPDTEIEFRLRLLELVLSYRF